MILARALKNVSSVARQIGSSSAAMSTKLPRHNPLEAFFEMNRNVDDKTPIVHGRGWKASELRLKSWDDLQKLWFVLLKEKNMLMTQRQMLGTKGLKFPNPERMGKVKKSMCRLKHVLTERAIAEPDIRRRNAMKSMINDL